MKYQFIKKDLDTYILKYGDKEIEFNTTIGIASRIQKHQEMAESQMILDLAKQGMTVNDLKIEKIKNLQPHLLPYLPCDQFSTPKIYTWIFHKQTQIKTKPNNKFKPTQK